jgi:hypothetical protein
VADELTDDLTLVPADEREVTAEEELDAAEASLLEEVGAIPVDPGPPIPFGRTWAFDFEAQRFIRSGTGGPVEVRGEAALIQWMQAVLKTAAGAHPSLPSNIGLDSIDEYIGTPDPSEALADFREDVQRALLVHDRIAAVQGPDCTHFPDRGLIVINRLVITTDEEEAVAILDFPLTPEV